MFLWTEDHRGHRDSVSRGLGGGQGFRALMRASAIFLPTPGTSISCSTVTVHLRGTPPK